MSVRGILHSTLDQLRDRFAPVSTASTFLSTGQLTPEEFVLAGDYLVYKFPSWSWADASSEAKQVAYLPAGKQFLITRGVPCSRRLGEGFAGDDGEVETFVRDELSGGAGNMVDGKLQDDEDWLTTGNVNEGVHNRVGRIGDVKTLGDQGNTEDSSDDDEELEIPDIDDDEEDEAEAIIKDETAMQRNKSLRLYTLHITYTPYYRTPRLFLSGHYPADASKHAGQPIRPQLMMQDIVGDYADKTVTLEDFPYYDNGLKMASIHPCRHASVMKTLLDRADAALKLRNERSSKPGQAGAANGKSTRDVIAADTGMEDLVDDISKASLIEQRGRQEGTKAAGNGEEWEMLHQQDDQNDNVAIRVDQYLVVFLKFMASVTPGMNYDFTMGV